MNASQFLAKLKTLTYEDLIEIKGVGEVLAQNIVDFAHSQRHNFLVESLEKLEQEGKGLTIELSSKLESETAPLANEIICITGSFEISRDIIKEKLEQMGAKVSSSVSAKTTILLAGEEAGSKLTKAQSLGVKIVRNLTDIGLSI